MKKMIVILGLAGVALTGAAQTGGNTIHGNDRVISHAPVNNNGEIVLDVLRIKAENMAQALELAKQCPTLDVGGSVEVREGLVLPGSANN